jgi:rhodanese-related sulfurtransferase
MIGVDALKSLRDAVIVDLRSSMAYRKAHIAGSSWSIRPRILPLPGTGRSSKSDAPCPPSAGERVVVLIADDRAIARIASIDLREASVNRIALLEGGLEAWRKSGGAIESSPDRPSDVECIDYLFFVHDRHDGNKESARRYLAWETQLLSRLDDQELGSYRLHRA